MCIFFSFYYIKINVHLSRVQANCLPKPMFGQQQAKKVVQSGLRTCLSIACVMVSIHNQRGCIISWWSPGELQGSEDSCITGQTGWDSEQPDLSVAVPVHCRKLDKMVCKGFFQLKQFYNSMIHAGGQLTTPRASPGLQETFALLLEHLLLVYWPWCLQGTFLTPFSLLL